MIVTFAVPPAAQMTITADYPMPDQLDDRSRCSPAAEQGRAGGACTGGGDFEDRFERTGDWVAPRVTGQQAQREANAPVKIAMIRASVVRPIAAVIATAAIPAMTRASIQNTPPHVGMPASDRPRSADLRRDHRTVVRFKHVEAPSL